ncbi:MAG: hypothetical protein AAF709_19610, partial [Pseudomonadota bacterium]
EHAPGARQFSCGMQFGLAVDLTSRRSLARLASNVDGDHATRSKCQTPLVLVHHNDHIQSRAELQK